MIPVAELIAYLAIGAWLGWIIADEITEEDDR